jgi:geranylgeranyl reductase family protein
MEKIENFDVCIIGGSIAGNYLCYLLRNSSLKIAVVEEHKEVGIPLQCAGIISQKLTQLIDVPDNIILNRVSIAKAVSPSGKFIKLSGEEQPYIIDRIALDQIFYEKVKDWKSIHYFLGEKFIKFEYIIDNHQKLVLIETNKRKIQVKLLIGCDGPLSSVAKTFGIKNRNLYAAQIRVKDNKFDQDEAVMYFNPKWKELFGWIVPEGNGINRIGMATSKDIKKRFDSFVKLLGINQNSIVNKQGGLIPYGMMNKLAFDNVLLLGDSACQVKATSGGGIVMLLEAAKYAATCIFTCFKNNNFSKRNIKYYYEKPCQGSIGKQLRIHYIISLIFESFKAEEWDTLFQIVKTRNIEEIISFYGDMDFPKRLFLKLIMNYTIFKFTFKIIVRNPKLLFKLFKTLFI